jgi:hypothetical protein
MSEIEPHETAADRASAERVAFLRARFDEEERTARSATPGPWRHDPQKHWRKPGTSWFEEAVFAGPAGEEAVCVAGTGETDDPQSMADAAHIARHDPARVLAEIEIDRELLRQYERLLRAHDAHQRAAAELAADIEHEERTGQWEGVGSPDVRQRALRREADYLPAMLRVMETWAKGKAAVHADHPDYREEWRP